MQSRRFAVAPHATIRSFLALEGPEAVEVLVDCFISFLCWDSRRKITGSKQRVIVVHDRVQDIVAVGAVTGDAPFNRILGENSFLHEDALDEETVDDVDKIVLIRGESIVPGTVDLVFCEGFPGGIKTP